MAALLAIVFGGKGNLSLTASERGHPLIKSFAAPTLPGDSKTWTTTQDQSGVLYFGTDGLVAYDGDRWAHFPMGEAYAVRGLDFGDDGRLWANGAGDLGWFERTPDEQWIFKSLRSHLPEAHASVARGGWSVYADREGAVFVCEDGILRWDGRTFHFWPLPGARWLPSIRIAGSVYVHHRPTGIHAFTPTGPLVAIPHAQLPERALILWMEQRHDGWLIVCSSGVFLWSEGAYRNLNSQTSSALSAKIVTCAARLKDGRLAVGTMNDGIVVLKSDGSIDERVNELIGAPTNSVMSMFVDREGSLWATSLTGVFHVAISSSSRLFNARTGIHGLPTQKILRHNGAIVIATQKGIYRLSAPDGAFVPIPGANERYSDLASTEDGLLLAGMGGTRIYDGTAVAMWRTALQDAFALKQASSIGNGVLISEGRDVVAADHAGNKRVLVQQMPDIATSIAEGSNGRLWLGTDARGILLAELLSESPVSARTPPPEVGLPPNLRSARVIGVGNGDILALSQAGGGWFMYAQEHNFSAIQSYPPWPIVAVTDVTADRTIWVLHHGGDRPAAVGRLTISDRHAFWEPHSVEGLASVGAPKSIFAETEANKPVLWIGGTEGVLRHVVTAGLAAPRPGAPMLSVRAQVGADNYHASAAARLPYTVGSIQFTFAQPEFAQRAERRLETRIDGIDGDWIAAGPDSRRELTAVRDGHYLFRVRAVAETGIASDETTFGFQVLPPWWRTPTALVGGLLAIVPLCFGLYRLRLRTLQRRNEQLEQKVHERTEELERASAAKTEFVANMSHDIRNPLNGIVGLALALEDTKLDSNQRDLVSTLRECTTYLSSLVDDVLDFASIEAGKVELRNAPFTPGELLNSVVTTLKADTAERGASIYVEVDPVLPAHLSGDAGRIQQILVNYVSNALKYAGGDIHVSASIPADAPNEVEFAVTDHGRGISDDDKATLFTKFTRLSGARQADLPGAGLGLASCRLLADIMSGSVGVESRLGEGARFFLRLPLTAATPVEAAELAELPNTTVLLVEDTDYNALAATAVLRRLGLNCERARNGEEALRLFAAKRFNIVLLDRNLPDIDGVEVARRMRQLETDGLQAIILAVTAYCTAKDKQLCLDAGMDAFVGKPLTPEKLRKVLLTTGRRLLASSTLDVSQEATAAAESSARPTPVRALDTSLLTYLSDGTERGYELQVARFLATLAAAKSEIDRAHANRNLEELATCAHKILGQARMIDGTGLIDAAEQLELSARIGDFARCDDYLGRVGVEIVKLTAALRHHRSSAATN